MSARHPEVGQVYRSAKPGDGGSRIRLTDVTATSAAAVEHANGRPLSTRIPLRQLHASPVTGTGRRRAAGWILEPAARHQTQRSSDRPLPAKPWRVVLTTPTSPQRTAYRSQKAAYDAAVAEREYAEANVTATIAIHIEQWDVDGQRWQRYENVWAKNDTTA